MSELLENLENLGPLPLSDEDNMLLRAVGYEPSLNGLIENAAAAEWLWIARRLRRDTRDCLFAAYENGPLFDGDLPSKGGCKHAMRLGLMTKVVYHGEEGYNAVTGKGAWVRRIRMAIESHA